MLKYFENLSPMESTIFAAMASIFVGFSTDADVLALLPATLGMLIKKAVVYGGGATILYKMQPKQESK